MSIHKIPNTLTIALAVAFYAYAFVTSMAMQDIAWHTMAGAVILLVGWLVHATNMLRSPGAAKLMAVIFLWFGFAQGFEFVAISWIFLGVFALVIQVCQLGNRVPYLPCAVLAGIVMVAV